MFMLFRGFSHLFLKSSKFFLCIVSLTKIYKPLKAAEKITFRIVEFTINNKNDKIHNIWKPIVKDKIGLKAVRPPWMFYI